MTAWLRFEQAGRSGFGVLEADTVHVYDGDLFLGCAPTGERLPLAELTLTLPCVPSKLLGLSNNYRALAAKQGSTIPAEPFYFIKGANSYLAHGKSLRAPRSYTGRVVYEGELGVVIGRRAYEVDLAQAEACIFGYTCVNDVTALDLILGEPALAQWTRAKSFDGFGAFGPVISTGLDGSALTVRTLVNGRERQNYPTSDMIFSPAQLVRLLSRELTLEPGDLITCGTSLGVGVLKPETTVEVAIDGIGVLRNLFVAS